MNNNIGVFGTLFCLILATLVSWLLFGGLGLFFGILWIAVTVGLIAKAHDEAKLAALDRRTQDTLRKIAELKKRNG